MLRNSVFFLPPTALRNFSLHTQPPLKKPKSRCSMSEDLTGAGCQEMEATVETTPPKRKKKRGKKIKRRTPSCVLNPAWRRHICPTPTPSFLAGDNSTDARLKKKK